MITSTLIGVILAISAGVVQSLGFVAQKHGHNEANKLNRTLPKEEQKSVLHQRIWWIGICTFLTGATVKAISLNFAAQSIVSPLGAINLVTIALLSYFILREPLERKDLIAIFIIVAGLVIVVVFGPNTGDGDTTLDDLRDNFTQLPFIIYVSLYTTLTIGVYITIKYFERVNTKTSKNAEVIENTVAPEDKLKSGSKKAPVRSDTYRDHTDAANAAKGKNVLLFGYVWISCFFASNNVLFVKSLVTILFRNDASDGFTDWLTYLTVVGWIVCQVLMEYFRQLALSHFGTLYVVPTFAVLGMIATSSMGLIYFREFDSFTLLSGILFCVGILVTLAGVLALSYDVGRYLDEKWGKVILVAFAKYDESNSKYAETVVVGGPISEWLEQYFYTHAPRWGESTPIRTMRSSTTGRVRKELGVTLTEDGRMETVVVEPSVGDDKTPDAS